MKRLNKELYLPEGNYYADILQFEEKDASILWNIYNDWINLCHSLNNLDARSVNLPEGLSESAFCLAHNVWRVNSVIKGANFSFDCYDPKEKRYNNRIQVKACSVLPDLTSFGPRSVWDKIYFLDFYREGNWDGTFDIYEIETDDINNYPVNINQTLLEQKLQGRRPRFSIYNGLIKNKHYISKQTYKISVNGVKKIN